MPAAAVSPQVLKSTLLPDRGRDRIASRKLKLGKLPSEPAAGAGNELVFDMGMSSPIKHSPSSRECAAVLLDEGRD